MNIKTLLWDNNNESKTKSKSVWSILLTCTREEKKMKLKLKRTLSVIMMCLMGFNVPVFAQTEKVRDPIFMGKVLEVEKNEKDSNIRIKVKGYIKSCEIYEKEIIAIINKDTKIVNSNCNKEKKDDEKKNEENTNKFELTSVNIEKGDTVFIHLDKAMTKSIPPQVGAKKIQITKVKS